MIHSNLTPPPIASLAFSEGSAAAATVGVGELLEGFITPKREANFFRRKTHSGIDEQLLKSAESIAQVTNLPGSACSRVEILIGTRERMEEWMRENGSGSSCLWAEAEDFSQSSRRGKLLSRQLKLTYRLQSEETFYVPILRGTLLELSPSPAQLGQGGGLRMASLKKGNEVKRPASLVEPDSSTTILRPLVEFSSNSSGGMSPSTAKAFVKAENGKSVGLMIPEKAYKQLIAMVSQGGIIREYQDLLRRSLDNPNFVDVDFQLLDLHQWMRHRPFAAFMKESDAVVIRRGPNSTALLWTLLRFDFGEALVRSTKGNDLGDLERVFGNNGIKQDIGSRSVNKRKLATSKAPGWWGQTVTPNVDISQQLGMPADKVDWKVWRIAPQIGESCYVSLTRLLFDILAVDCPLTSDESVALQSLFGTKEQCHSGVQVRNISSVSAFQKPSQVSSKEQCALSHLRSNSEELKSQGLQVLLNLLLSRTPSTRCLGSSHSNVNTTSTGSPSGLHDDEEGIESSFRNWQKKSRRTGNERRLSLGQPTTHEAVRRLKDKRTAGVGGDCERTTTGEDKGKCQSTGIAPQNDEACNVHEMETRRLLDWLKSGFLEALVERMLVASDVGVLKGDSSERGDFLSIEVVADACLRALEIVPRESSAVLATILAGSLKRTLEDFTDLVLNPKQNESCEKSVELSDRPDTGMKANNRTSDEIRHPSKAYQSTNLMGIFKKVLRFSKLLSLLTSNSPLVGGPLAKAGGLDLVLDLYFCIIKRFPIDLRLGALLSKVPVTKRTEQILPGAVLKNQDTSLKVLPCILPSACIRKIAQACLMGHCLTPQKEKTDLIWPSTMEWTVCSSKQLVIDSHRNFSDESHNGVASDNTHEGCLQLVPSFNSTLKTPDEVELNKPNLLHPNILTPERKCGCPNSLTISSSLLENDCSSPCPPTRDSILEFEVSHVTAKEETDKCTSTSQVMKQSKPFVPRLSLKSLRSSTTRFGTPVTEPAGSKVLPTLATFALPRSPTVAEASTSEFDIFIAVYNLKFELLRTMISLFSNHCQSLLGLKNRLLARYEEQSQGQLALQFLPDIIEGFLSTVPENTSRQTKKMLLKVISLLDKKTKSDDVPTIEKLSEWRTGEASGPSQSSESERFVDVMLVEIGDRLQILVFHLTQLLDQESTNFIWQTCHTPGSLEVRHPLLGNHTICSGHILSLWVDVGLLLRVLANFVVLWPEVGSVQLVLNSCGRQVESILGLLSEYSTKRSWSLAQILTMEPLLKFLTVCMKSVASENCPEQQSWGVVDTFFWQLLVMNDLHWNCIKSFTTWVVMKSCQGCLQSTFENYLKALWEPLEIYYRMLGERINCKLFKENVRSIHGDEISTKTIFPFLRVNILLMKKRLKCQNQSTDPCPNLHMGRLIFLLEFLMNPVEGLLMSVISNSISCIKQCKIQSSRADEALNISNCINSPQSISENHVRAIPEPFHANHGTVSFNQEQEQCRKCSMESGTTTCIQKFTLSCMEQESLSILAEIFALKAFDFHGEQASVCVNPHTTNPFLFGKYVSPFLEIIFLCFLKFYNRKLDYCEQWLLSPFSQRTSGLSHISGNSDQGLSEQTTTDDRSSELKVPKSGHPQDDISSVACVTYGHVLRVLAQNQTDDVSQSFQHIRVMKFLVQQIGLEYEFLEVPTPQDAEMSLEAGVITTPVPLQEVQCSELSDFEAKVTKAGLIWSGRRSKLLALHTKEQDPDTISAGVGEDVDTGHTNKEAMFVSSQDSIQAREPRSNKVVSIPSSQESRASLEAKALRAIELRLGSYLQNPSRAYLGFHSARVESFPLHKRVELETRSPDQVEHSSQQEAIPGKAGLQFPQLLRQADDHSVLKKESQSERGCSSALASSERKSGGVIFSSRSLQGRSGFDTRLSVRRSKSHLQDEPLDTNRLMETSNASDCGPTSVEGFQAGLQEEGDGALTIKSSIPIVRYTGRFFDLNKEVEMQLAQEDSFEAKCHLSRDGSFAQKSHSENYSNLDQMQVKPTRKQGSSNLSSASGSSLELKSENSLKKNPDRPSIPRLNLFKSVRKGGPTISSFATIDLDLYSSTASTRESKGRLSSIFKLQKELQKELVSSDRDSKSLGIGASYETERLQRRIYRHARLHVLLLELFVLLMLTPGGTLEACYSDRYPMEKLKLNAPFFLSYHLNHAANIHLLPCLTKRMKDFKPAAFRILKLTWRTLFSPKIYTDRVCIARGALSQVYTAKVRRPDDKSDDLALEQVVLKIVDVPKGPYDPCRFFDVYSEVEILEKFLGEPAVCQIVDYGVDTESFILVLKHYKCSLCTWRQGRRGSSMGKTFSPVEIQRAGVVAKFVLERLPLYLEVYAAVLQAVKALEVENVVHYDLKCDNILLDPMDPFCSDSEFWSPIWPPAHPSRPLPFRVCIADFGQSKASTYLGGECTVRNRGTEYVKSPEMLKLLSSQSERDFNLRNSDEGVGKAVDVWSLGCLLYELLTGEYLFYHEDWLQFFMRVTLPSEELITKDKAEKLNNYGPVVDLLRFILVRDPLLRPSLDDVAICVEQLQLKVKEQGLSRIGHDNEDCTQSDEDMTNSNSSSDDEVVFSNEVEIAPERKENKPEVRKGFLDRLVRLICCCRCGKE